MACFAKAFTRLVFTVFVFVNQVEGDFNFPEAKNGRIKSQSGRRCLAYQWDVQNLAHPCVYPECNVTLSVRLFKGSGSSMTKTKQDILSKQQARKDNSSSSYAECLYDSSTGENASCCEDINSTSGQQVPFSGYERITVAVTICIRGANSCYSSSPGPEMKVLPWRDPCFLHRPCQQREFAVCHPAVDDYRCECQYRWTGKKCDVLKNMTEIAYQAGKCLNMSADQSAQNLYDKTVEECRSICSRAKCKSFEFRKAPLSLHGNCTLRDSNSLERRILPCNADLYELKSFLTATNAPTTTDPGTPKEKYSGLSVAVVVIIVYILVLVLVSVLVVLIAKPFNRTKTPTRSQSNLGAFPPGTRPAITNNNASFVQCIYDSSAGENVSCCNSANPGVVLTSGYSLSFSNYENIRFDIRTCLNDSGNCVLKNELSFILPWYNPCFFSNPCLNHGNCVPAVKNYNCSCDVDWKGDNCSIPKDITYHAGKCLDYSSDADVKHYMRTVGECRMSCLFMGSSKCKSFELKKMATGNHGNCTFRNSNSRAQKLTQCEADLYELTKYLNPSSAPSVGIVALHLLLMLLATVFLKE